MLVECKHCQAIISNDRDECPWCLEWRRPLQEQQRKKQISLLGLILVVSAVGIWLGFTLRESLP